MVRTGLKTVLMWYSWLMIDLQVLSIFSDTLLTYGRYRVLSFLVFWVCTFIRSLLVFSPFIPLFLFLPQEWLNHLHRIAIGLEGSLHWLGRLLTRGVSDTVCSICQTSNNSIEDPGMVVRVIVQIPISMGLPSNNSRGESVVLSGHQKV